MLDQAGYKAENQNAFLNLQFLAGARTEVFATTFGRTSAMRVDHTVRPGGPIGFEALDQLGVEHPLDELAARPRVLRQLGRRLAHPLPDGGETAAQRLVVERLELGLEAIDFIDDRRHPLEVALVLRPEDDFDSLFDQVHCHVLVPDRPAVDRGLRLDVSNSRGRPCMPRSRVPAA